MNLMRLQLQAPHLHESLSRLCRLFSLFCCTFFILKRLPKLHTLQNLPCPAPPACRGPAPATCSEAPLTACGLGSAQVSPPSPAPSADLCTQQPLHPPAGFSGLLGEAAPAGACIREQTRIWGRPQSQLPPSTDSAIPHRQSACCLPHIKRADRLPHPRCGGHRAGRRRPFFALRHPQPSGNTDRHAGEACGGL